MKKIQKVTKILAQGWWLLSLFIVIYLVWQTDLAKNVTDLNSLNQLLLILGPVFSVGVFFSIVNTTAHFRRSLNPKVFKEEEMNRFRKDNTD